MGVGGGGGEDIPPARDQVVYVGRHEELLNSYLLDFWEVIPLAHTGVLISR